MHKFVVLLVAALSTTLVSTKVQAEATTTKAHSHDHKPTTVEVTLKELEKRPKTKLKLAKNDTVIYVADLHCGHCAKKIASKLYTVKGVVKVRTDVKADVAIVTPQSKKKVDPVALWNAAQKSGFPAIKLVGPDGTYVLDPKTKSATKMAVKSAAAKS